MLSEAFRSLVKPMETVRRFIWMAFIAAVPIDVCILYMQLVWTAPGVMPGGSNFFTISLVVLSLLAALLAPYMPGLLLSDSRLRQFLAQQPDPEAMARNYQTGKVDEDRLARIKTISPDEQRLLALVPYFFVGFSVRLAFNESIALYGFVLAFFSRSFVAILPFAMISLVLNWTVPFPLDSALDRAASLGLKLGDIPAQPR